ncbi:MAG: PaaI family thioesterase [Caulobacteraceae bacterium]|nr:PaaI family thioesterase [Caulobacteraceae bacterium]
MEAAEPRPSSRAVTEGEWAGWTLHGTDPFEEVAGPFYAREDAAGRTTCAFRVAPKHLNGAGVAHGGALLAFADFALYCIAMKALDGAVGLTTSLNAEFVDAAREGDLVEASGEIVRAGGTLIFLRGVLAAEGRPLLTCSTVLKKLRAR